MPEVFLSFFFLWLLKRLGGSCFVTVVGDGGLGALLECSEVELLEFDRKFVYLELVPGGLWEADFKLDWDHVSEWVAAWTSDSKVNIPDFRLISDHVWEDGEGDSDLD